MGEGKGLNKYHPSDLDPAKIPPQRQPKNQQIKVRMMLLMSIRCNTCGTYIYKGTKFNSRKKDVIGEATEKEKKKRGAEEMGDAMKSLKNRALDSKQDMDILAALEEMKSMKSRHATVSVDDVLATLERSAYEKEKRIMDEIDKADDEVIKSIIFLGSKDFVRRIQDEEDEDLVEDLHQPSSSLSQSSENDTEGKVLQDSQGWWGNQQMH